MTSRKEDVFFKSSAVILVATAVAKLYSASGSARILLHSDMLLHLNIRMLMIGVALLEMVVADVLVRNQQSLLRAAVLLWLSSNFMVYRFANEALGIKYCPCLGTVGESLPVSQAQLSIILTGVVLYWFFGSSYILWRAWTEKQEADVEAIIAARQGPAA